jgi:hypothetical protein
MTLRPFWTLLTDVFTVHNEILFIQRRVVICKRQHSFLSVIYVLGHSLSGMRVRGP